METGGAALKENRKNNIKLWFEKFPKDSLSEFGLLLSVAESMPQRVPGYSVIKIGEVVASFF